MDRKISICLIIIAVSLPFQAGRLAAMPVPIPVDERRDSIAEATVYGNHLLSRTGIFDTRIDSTALKRNISSSLAGLLSYSSAVFIKQHGRSSISTVSLRGTAPSHTRVLWNGMEISSPMLGTADFSLIPAFFMDAATVLHGASSLQEVSGGLGGAILLETSVMKTNMTETTSPKSTSSKKDSPEKDSTGKHGPVLRYIQGFGSWLTADEYLEAGYNGRRFSTSTKILLSTSKNDFRFTNMDKKEIKYDENMNIIDSWHPVEKNRNGEYRDLHIMQGFGWKFRTGGRLELSAWYLDSWRELPLQTVDYGTPKDYMDRQKEQSLRTVLRWSMNRGNGKTHAAAGYSGTRLGYDYAFGNGNNPITYMTESRSRSNSVYLSAGHEQYLGRRLLLSASLSGYWHSIRSSDRSALTQTGGIPGYEGARAEMSASATARWQASRSLALALTLREEMDGKDFSPPLPALNADLLIWENWNLYLKAAASMNYRYPTLNDLYFLPGGNPDLRPESGISYDLGYSLAKEFPSGLGISAAGGWFDSWIDDWILWVPEGARKDFWTPVNVMKVHAYGIEQALRMSWKMARDWKLDIDSHFTWSPSIDSGSDSTAGDHSAGKQLQYIPEFAASFTAGLSWKKWSVTWKWCWYSRRYTTSDNSGSVPPYIMNDLDLGRKLDFRWADLDMGLSIRNLFNEQYVSVLSRPMPGINYEFYIGITPHFLKKR